LWEQEEALREIKDLLSSQATEFSIFEQRMGRINYLVSNHGSVTDAVEQALAGGGATNIVAINKQMEQCQDDLKDVVNELETSKNTLLQLLLKVQEARTHQCETLKECIFSVESLHAAQAPPQSGQGVSSLSPSITADTVFGVGQVGGVDFELSINSLFGLVHLLEAKVQILSNRTKKTGFQFGDLAFAPETEFVLAYPVANSSGVGTAGFVDFILIWQFAALGQANLSTWLMQEHTAKDIGFSSTARTENWLRGTNCNSAIPRGHGNGLCHPLYLAPRHGN
jgi:hypothetical protein